MSGVDAAALLDRIEQDADFAAELADLAAEGDPSRVHARISEAGYDASPAELRHALLRRYADSLPAAQLAAVAAGAWPEAVGVRVGAAGVLGVVLAAAIAAS